MESTRDGDGEEMSRRQLVTGLAWSVPAIATDSGAPAYAASPSEIAVHGGMFNTVEASGYGYDRYDGGARSILQGFAQGTLDGTERHWSDSTGYPTVKIGYPGVRSNIINLQGSYTPGGTSGTTFGQNYYGSGMWMSSPVDRDGVALVGSTTLQARATFHMCLKVVGVTRTGVGSPSGYVQTNSLAADMASNGTRLARNGVSLALTKTTWSTTGPDSQGLYTGQGCITFQTNSDLTVSGTASKTNYTQLMLTPGLQLLAGLGNGILLYCSTLSFASGTFVTNVEGQETEVDPPNLGTVTSYVRAEFDQSSTRWGGGTTRYTGTC